MDNWRVGIALTGKGATNHLHRTALVEALAGRGMEVSFLVRRDYIDLLGKLEGCRYYPFQEPSLQGWRRWLVNFSRSIRSLYPPSDPAVRYRFDVQVRDKVRISTRLLDRVQLFLAGRRLVLNVLLHLEQLVFRKVSADYPLPEKFDLLVLLGIGTAGTELDALLTHLARGSGIKTLHLVGNYDGLASKGYRGVAIDRLLVWGNSMEQDALELQHLDSARIRRIGPVRYDAPLSGSYDRRDQFLETRGLDPRRKTILFAGSRIEYHYFEMLSLYEAMRSAGEDHQLIIRIYPNKNLLNSPYIKPLLSYTSKTEGVYVSMGDPHYEGGSRDHDVLEIEETELWECIAYSDVVVNLYSTISLEACFFNKPVINMWYFGGPGRLMLRKPVYIPYPLTRHIRKMLSYGATVQASSREELASAIRDAIQYPEQLAPQREVAVREELGFTDGMATARFAEACGEFLGQGNPKLH